MNFASPLQLEWIDGHDWRLLSGFTYSTTIGDLGTIIVPAGFVTDFASVPRGLWNLFPPTGTYGKAAVIHDALYRMSGVRRDIADQVFLEAMGCLGVSWLTRHTIYSAVRTFGRGAYKEKKAEEAAA